MTAWRALARKEILEFTRTWRIRVLLIPMLLFAIGSPVFTYFSPEILENTLEVYGDGDIHIEVPIPNWIDSYLQWARNLKQVIPILLLVITGGAIANEITSGSVIPLLTNGLSRRTLVITKFIVISGIAILAIAFSTMVNWMIGWMLFPDTRLIDAFAIIGVASVLSLLLIALAIFGSSFMPDAIGAVGLELSIFFLLSIGTLWEPARSYSPVGLLSALPDLARDGEAEWLWPATSSLTFTIVLLAMTVTIFRRREL